MPEELQSLLERIQKDGVQKAEAEARKITETAKEKADAIVAEAGRKAETALAKAKQDAAVFQERGNKALEQAARDVILAAGEAVKNTLTGVIKRDVTKAMTTEALQQMIAAAVQAYSQQRDSGSGLKVLLNPKQQQTITDALMAKCATAMRAGLEVKGDSGIVAGFRISVAGEEVQHDFTAEAIGEAMGQLLRPQLAGIVKQALDGMTK